MDTTTRRLDTVTLADLSPEQRHALDVMNSGRSVFLSGCAGSGKTSVVKLFLQGRDDAVVCASTGIAALLDGGCTVHSLFCVPLRPLEPHEYCEAVNSLTADDSASGYAMLSVARMRLLFHARTLVIDEVSMLRFDVFQYVVNTIRRIDERRAKLLGDEAWRTQVVAVGDFCQLSPILKTSDAAVLADVWNLDAVPDGNSSFAFMCRGWWDLGMEPVVLHESHRQKRGDFLSSLNDIRLGGTDGLGWINNHASWESDGDTIVLATTNQRAAEINEVRLEELPGQVFHLNAVVTGEVRDCPADKRLSLKEGARVMALINGNGYCNGSVGTVVSVQVDPRKCPSVTVRFDDAGIVEVPWYRWTLEESSAVKDEDGKWHIIKKEIGSFAQVPLRLAYAVTVHKAQGQTYERLVLNGRMFASGHLYVALSRLTSIDGLCLCGPITPGDVLLSENVRLFYADPTTPPAAVMGGKGRSGRIVVGRERRPVMEVA